ncbi:hypothetical protein [Streptomyces sp. V4I2]|uniref:hypothetical protein n=1 Tax=Streptomyces sp. V4I2 TaxID=3042280 RepID=UPI002788E321|nr:hypothetical protein [Streptomyces sp. V4I2]MDQ1050832.1 hypothetical protein [Streptomyces sp. V4I2]
MRRTATAAGSPRRTGLENGAPGEPCAEAFLHYPHPEGVPVQQECARQCGVDLSQWHDVAVEWTSDHVRGFIKA